MPLVTGLFLDNLVSARSLTSANDNFANSFWHGAMQSRSARSTGEFFSGPSGCLVRKKLITSPIVIRSAEDASLKPPLLPRREVTNPPHTSSCKIFAVSAIGTLISREISGDCISRPDSARQQSALSADCSRFGNAGHMISTFRSRLSEKRGPVCGQKYKVT